MRKFGASFLIEQKLFCTELRCKCLLLRNRPDLAALQLVDQADLFQLQLGMGAQLIHEEQIMFGKGDI